MKTLIELFDVCQVENAIAGLRFKPEKIVFVGFKKMMYQKRKEALINFFEKRSENIKLEFEIVGQYDYNSIVEKFNYIIDNNEDCGFDLTGGKEIVLAAMGEVSAKRNVPLFQINVRDGNIVKIKNCNEIIETEKNTMTIEEAVGLNCCSVVRNEKNDFNWDFSGDFKNDVNVLWGICKVNFGLWNYQSSIFESFEKLGSLCDDLSVRVNLAHMKKGGHNVFLNKRIITSLLKHGLICDFNQDEDLLNFRYKNNQVRQCLIKAGNILEIYTFLLLHEIEKETPSYYDDMDIGVYIDWDGVQYNEEEKVAETRNEVDIMVMRDLVPLFISCKNGEVHKEALYELDTVSRKFGGKYAKRFLLASYISLNADAEAYIRQRAKDMDITIVSLSDIDVLDRESFKKRLRNIIK